MKKVTSFLASTKLTAILLLVLMVSLIVSTFFEQRYGSNLSRYWFYHSSWFKVLFFLISVNLLFQVIFLKLYKITKLPLLIFHASFLIIIAGAAVTHYFSKEGFVHLREGETAYTFKTLDSYFKVELSKNDSIIFKYTEKVTDLSMFNKEIPIKAIKSPKNSVLVKDFQTRRNKRLLEVKYGTPAISLVYMQDSINRKSIVLEKGTNFMLRGSKIGYTQSYDSTSICFFNDSSNFYVAAPVPIQIYNFRTGQASLFNENTAIPINEMDAVLLESGLLGVLKISNSAIIEPFDDYDTFQQGDVLLIDWQIDSVVLPLYLWVDSNMNGKTVAKNDSLTLSLDISPMELSLPFAVTLNKFMIDYYPGSNSPMAYRSLCTLSNDSIAIPMEISASRFASFMGWRIYQMSYDNDQKGTLLSVSYDPLGVKLTFLGYFLLFVFLIISLVFVNRSRFRLINPSVFQKVILILVTLSSFAFVSNGAENKTVQNTVANVKTINKLDALLIQDISGRTKPINTFSNEVIRKISGKTELYGLNASRIFWSIYADFDSWKNVPLIKIGNTSIAKRIGIGDKKYASFTDLVDYESGGYKIYNEVALAMSKPVANRTKFDKEIIKVDERLNVLYMVASGELLRVFPVYKDSSKWFTPKELIMIFQQESLDGLLEKHEELYRLVGILLPDSLKSLKNENSISKLIEYQRKNSKYSLPSLRKVNAEILYNKLNICENLFKFFMLIGFLWIIMEILNFIRGSYSKYYHRTNRVLHPLYYIGFGLLTFSILLRWYVAGRFPVSNGYETVIFISWISLLIGIIFKKSSVFILPGAIILSGFALLVAHLSFMDPQITNLVPVLQSPWLTIHVTVITSSYGFLGLSAIISLINLLLIAFTSNSNTANILKSASELAIINYRSMVIGLVLLTIGTFLGAIWANEAWGRYWGWDPKESWSLITIIAYTLVIHLWNIPGFMNLYKFSMLSFWAFASVLMTYFGVNYFFTGLHSYAGGSIEEAPLFIYILVGIFAALSLFGYFKFKKIRSYETN